MANKILYVCQEITPYLPETESSGLCRALTQAMQERGNEIRTFMPRYGCINERRHQLHDQCICNCYCNNVFIFL